MVYCEGRKVHCLPSVTGFSLKLVFNLAEHLTLLVTRLPTVPGWDLNPGPLSLEANALLTELMRPQCNVGITCDQIVSFLLVHWLHAS